MMVFLFTKNMIPERVLSWGLIVLACLFLLNRNGIFYRETTDNSISFGERSEEYVDGYTVLRDSLHLMETDIPPEVPIYCANYDYFYSQKSFLGYVSKPLPNTINTFYLTPFSPVQIDYLPNHFYMIVSQCWFGGEWVKEMLYTLEDDARFEMKRLTFFERGEYRAYIAEVKRRPEFPSDKAGMKMPIPAAAVTPWGRATELVGLKVRRKK